MKKFEQINAVSEKLLASTKLKKDQTATYKIANIQRAPWDHNQIMIPSAVSVPPVDQIWDEEKNDYVDIAAIRKVNKDGNHVFHDIWFYGSQGGHMVLKGGVAEHQEIHSYLMLCNFNGSNPNRDKTKEIIFELVDDEKKAVDESKKRNLKREALNIAADLSPEDVKVYVAAQGKDDTRKVAVMRDELEAFADKDPSGFLELINNKQAIMKATINRALAKGAIIFNQEQSRFEWPNKEAILTVSRTTGLDAVNELVSFCVSNAKGEKVFQTIESKSKNPKP